MKNYSTQYDADPSLSSDPAVSQVSSHRPMVLDLSGTGASGTSGTSRRTPWLLAAGAALATAALVVRQKTRQAVLENPPAGEFLQIDGVRLHYVERGQGQPVVFLHGNGTMIQDFETSGLIDLAAQKYRVIVFDRPGYGYSERPRSTIWTPQAQAKLLHRALLHLGIENPIIVGHSWGTQVAVSMALEQPDYVKSLVLMSGYYYPTARLDVTLAAQPAIPVLGDLMRFTVSPLLSRAIWPAVLGRIFGPAPVPARFKEEYSVWMTLRPSQLRAAAAEAALMIPAAYALQERYHELTMPVVIMAGADDKHVTTSHHSERLHAELPHSSLHVTAGAGHMLHHVAQEEVLAGIGQAASAVGAELRSGAVHSAAAPVGVADR
ncbi:alpha/beta hydrolase [Noviherbaspirillum sp. CPCC 100848]|uniref:Alpha/beta hydrolase n=1 Tax=Noviherbaspirillum album TaxID=3080276 RepID=A0ABU6J580_9BURK|nr:alpha/beta hydrolase [Noviherbaspirillum sp. CPCC 100848]MEC4718482.1 alpha/beta hydrolase [Noviherbaspirillum sp. CPCC 100848]